MYSGLIAHTQITPSVSRNLAPIPLTAFIKAEQNKALIYVLDGKQQVQKREVQFAYLQGGNALIAQGLQAGEKVVVQGGPFITEGQQIKVINDLSLSQVKAQAEINGALSASKIQ